MTSPFEPDTPSTIEASASIRRDYVSLLALGAAAAVAFVVSMMLGPDGFGLPGDPIAARLVLVEIRLPRALLGFLVGGALGLSGAALQGFLRNPLAEPGLLGVASGGALGAVLAVHTGAVSLLAFALPLGGLLGAAAATLAVVMLAGKRTAPVTLILAGVAISSLAGALTSLVLNLAPNPFASVEMLYWIMGSLNDRSLEHVGIAAPLIALGSLILMTTRHGLDALTLGEEAAANLGIDLASVRRRLVAGTALAVGAATSVSGTIGFVGLVVPHLLRPLVGYEPGRLLLPGFLGGAVVVTLADVAIRLISPAGDIKLGVATALIGAPFFLWLVVATRKELGA